MVEFNNFYQIIAKNKLFHWLETLPRQISIWNHNLSMKDQFKKWENSVKFLPKMIPYKIDFLHSVTVQSKSILSDKKKTHIKNLMKNLIPWKKGPFSIYGLNIDSEWRSDWKWNRVFPHLSDLNERTILDVGCGSGGYYLWRMIGLGARLVIGIDPVPLFLYQFEAIRKLLGNDQRAHFIPIRIEQLPELSAFDTVFSMGVLYHCRSPLDHLLKLKDQLTTNGELVLETLVIEGNETNILVPKGNYMRMKNVYFIPSVLALKNWLIKCGFIDIRVVDVSFISKNEQRYTKWTKNLLADKISNFEQDIKKDYLVPIRAILIAKKP